MMKFLKTCVQKNLSIILFLLCGFNSFSQDTLFYQNGNINVVNISYYTKNSITYKEYPDGLTSNVIGTTDIIKIVTSEGKKVDFKKDIYLDKSQNNVANYSSINNTESQEKNITFQSISNNGSIINLGKDVILLRSGEEINSKVLNVSTKEITYKKSDFLDGPTYSIETSTVFMITYSNGNKDIVKIEEQNKEISSETGLTDGELVTQAKSDAYYNFSGFGPFFAGFSSILLSPLFALIPAAIVSSNEPNESNLNCPNQELFNKNLQYQNAYRKEAHKIKKKHVWAGYGVGVLFNTLTALIIIYR